MDELLERLSVVRRNSGLQPTNSPARENYPDWSPDGNLLLFPKLRVGGTDWTVVDRGAG